MPSANSAFTRSLGFGSRKLWFHEETLSSAERTQFALTATAQMRETLGDITERLYTSRQTMHKFLFLFLVFPIFLNAQENEPKYDFALSPGLIIQKGVLTELNLMVGEVVADNMMVGIRGLRIGAESNLKSGSEFIIAPKIGFEMSAVLFSGRISAINYFQNRNSEFRVVPEIGFSIGGLINLTYGYGFKFEKTNISDLSQHRISLTFNLNRELIDGLK